MLEEHFPELVICFGKRCVYMGSRSNKRFLSSYHAIQVWNGMLDNNLRWVFRGLYHKTKHGAKISLEKIMGVTMSNLISWFGKMCGDLQTIYKFYLHLSRTFLRVKRRKNIPVEKGRRDQEKFRSNCSKDFWHFFNCISIKGPHCVVWLKMFSDVF